MLTVNKINIGTEKYGDGYQVTVGFQVGDRSYNVTDVTLPTEAAREIIDLIIKRATESLAVVGSNVRVAGEPLPIVEAAPEPEFAEVEEYIPPVPMAETCVPVAPKSEREPF